MVVPVSMVADAPGAAMQRLMIVEDDPLLRESLRILLSGEPGMSVVRCCDDAETALDALDQARPDTILSDLGLPGMSGPEFIRLAKQRMPDVDILVLTISEDRDAVLAALKAGACGYVVKGATPRELVEALVEVARGGAPMSPRIARMVIRSFQESAPDDTLLSPKERTVLSGIRDGLSYKALASRLNISPHTVHSHVKHIYEKLQAVDKRDALAKARRRGVL
jgi:two-component system NarL family response regulator